VSKNCALSLHSYLSGPPN